MNHSLPIQLVIADDHGIFREGFKLLLRDQQQIIITGEAGDGAALLEVVDRVQPDIVITDIKMPEMDGVQACKLIRDRHPFTKVIALSMFNDDHLIVDMLEAGASGYLLKNTNREELILACKSVYEGHNYYSEATSQKLARLVGNSHHIPSRGWPHPKFTRREKEVMKLIAEQLTNKEIADQLHLSVRTVESHRIKLQEKTGSRNGIGVIIYAIKHNLIEI